MSRPRKRQKTLISAPAPSPAPSPVQAPAPIQVPRDPDSDRSNSKTAGFRDPYETVIYHSKNKFTIPSKSRYDQVYRDIHHPNEIKATKGAQLVTFIRTHRRLPIQSTSPKESKLYATYRAALQSTNRSPACIQYCIDLLGLPLAVDIHVAHCTKGKKCPLCRGRAKAVTPVPTDPEAPRYVLSEPDRLELLVMAKKEHKDEVAKRKAKRKAKAAAKKAAAKAAAKAK